MASFRPPQDITTSSSSATPSMDGRGPRVVRNSASVPTGGSVPQDAAWEGVTRSVVAATSPFQTSSTVTSSSRRFTSTSSLRVTSPVKATS